MTDPVSVPPGWYSGGVVGEERWWDGSSWTEHARSTVVAPPRFQWSGSATGSLAVGIAVLVFSIGMIFFTFLTLISSGFFASLLPGFATIVMIGLGALAIANYAGLNRQNAAAAALEASKHQPPRA